MNRLDFPLILIVEDNALNRTVLSQMVQKLGYAFECAEDGESGIRAWNQGRFDLLLVDCQMPGMDGCSLAERIRQTERRNLLDRTPLVAVTAYCTESDRQICLSSGFDEHLAKPVLFQELSDTLKRYLESRKGQPDSQLPESAERSPSRSPECLDTRVLARLRALEAEGNPWLVKELAGIFVSLTPERVQGIRQAWKARDLSKLERLSHDLKSSCAALGVVSMGETCAAIERNARNFETEPLSDLVSRLDSEFFRARGVLEELMR